MSTAITPVGYRGRPDVAKNAQCLGFDVVCPAEMTSPMSWTRAQTASSSTYVFAEGGRPAFARRFEPVDEADSGWVFLSGHAAEGAADFGDVAANFRRNTLAELTDLFPELLPILSAPTDSELVWDEKNATYRLSLGDR